jgi:hypothetical protein
MNSERAEANILRPTVVPIHQTFEHCAAWRTRIEL